MGKGGRGGREQEEEPPRPNPTQPIPPPEILSLWETGQVRMSGIMSVKARCGRTRGHTVMSAGQRRTDVDGGGGGSGVDGV